MKATKSQPSLQLKRDEQGTHEQPLDGILTRVWGRIHEGESNFIKDVEEVFINTYGDLIFQWWILFEPTPRRWQRLDLGIFVSMERFPRWERKSFWSTTENTATARKETEGGATCIHVATYLALGSHGGRRCSLYNVWNIPHNKCKEITMHQNWKSFDGWGNLIGYFIKFP